MRILSLAELFMVLLYTCFLFLLSTPPVGAAELNVTEVTITNGPCGTVFFGGGRIDTSWSVFAAANDTRCYVSVLDEQTLAVVADNAINSQVPCVQGFLSIDIPSHPVSTSPSWQGSQYVVQVLVQSTSAPYKYSCPFR